MYITQAEFEAFLKRSLTTSEAASFAIVAGNAKAVIDTYCETNFDADVASSSRYYDGDGTSEIILDPCNTVTEVAFVDNTDAVSGVVSETNYILEPRNNTIKWSLRLRAGRFSFGVANIKVTAKFSSYDSAVPAEVKFACFKLCSDAYRNASGMESESIEGYSYKMRPLSDRDAEITSALSKFRREYV
jgi:hypothetical protein